MRLLSWNQTYFNRAMSIAHRIRKPGNVEEGLSSAIFTVRNEIGSLSQILAAFQKHGVSLCHIESRPNKGAYVVLYLFMICQAKPVTYAAVGVWGCARPGGSNFHYDFDVTFEGLPTDPQVRWLLRTAAAPVPHR